MTDLRNSNSLHFVDEFPVQIPRNIDRGVTLGDHALDADSVARIGWLLSESEGVDLR